MDDKTVDSLIIRYTKENLSPKQSERDYITEKYDELRSFLKCNCFQSGSYARFTAICPVHDLDVIHPVPDASIEHNPGVVLDSLYSLLEDGYSKSKISNIKRITRQSHSITIEFADSEEPFSIDVVPAIELSDEPLNEYGEPFYKVPEILRMNKYQRSKRYEMSENEPIQWIRTDPRGYIQAASDLNKINPNFRHSTKFGKGWRHVCKIAYGDKFCFKSFHFELMFYKYFTENPNATTLEAITDCFGAIPQALYKPQFRDRADDTRFVDEYVQKLTQPEKQFILKLQAEAYSKLLSLHTAATPEELFRALESFFNIKKDTPILHSPPTVISRPHQPWSY